MEGTTAPLVLGEVMIEQNVSKEVSEVIQSPTKDLEVLSAPVVEEAL